MRETTAEIKRVFDKHPQLIKSVVVDVMQTFKRHFIVWTTV